MTEWIEHTIEVSKEPTSPHGTAYNVRYPNGRIEPLTTYFLLKHGLLEDPDPVIVLGSTVVVNDSFYDGDLWLVIGSSGDNRWCRRVKNDDCLTFHVSDLKLAY